MKMNDSEVHGDLENPLMPKGRSKSGSTSVSTRNRTVLVAEMRIESSLQMDSRIQETTNQSMSEKLRTSMDDFCTSERKKTIPVSDFLRSFRENGAHFISSAYL